MWEMQLLRIPQLYVSSWSECRPVQELALQIDVCIELLSRPDIACSCGTCLLQLLVIGVDHRDIVWNIHAVGPLVLDVDVNGSRIAATDLPAVVNGEICCTVDAAAGMKRFISTNTRPDQASCLKTFTSCI